MANTKEILQGLAAAGGFLSAIVGYLGVRAKHTSEAALKKIDVSSEWQAQMLARITAVEQELKAERVRGDLLEKQFFEARAEANELAWQLGREKAERLALGDKLEKLEREKTLLQKQNLALVDELRELNKQIRSGHPSPTLPPVGTRKGGKPPLPKGG